MDEKLSRKEIRLLEEADQEDARTEAWERLLLTVLWVSGLSAALTLGAQTMQWLKTGNWPAYNLMTLGAEPLSSSWVGLNEIYQFILELPLIFDCLAVAFVVVMLFTRNERKPVSEALKNARMKRARLSQKSEEN